MEDESVPNAAVAGSTEHVTGTRVTQEVLFAGDEGRSVLTTSLTDDNVASARVWLEDQGYGYIDSNSIVLIEHEYDYTIDPVEPGGMASKRALNNGSTVSLVRADTVVWLAFESPSYDPANHTAVITHRTGDGENETILIELDVSTEIPTPIRKGLIIDGVFEPGDIPVENFLGCLLSGAAGAATACLMSNCGWAVCMGAGAGGTVVACAIAELF